MQPILTPSTNKVYELPGGTRENDLPVEVAMLGPNRPAILSVWEPTPAEREAIAAGANLLLCVEGAGQPPVSLSLTSDRRITDLPLVGLNEAGSVIPLDEDQA